MKRALFDSDWRFTLDAAVKPGREMNDTAWRRVHVPHDWSIELPRTADAPSGPSGGFAHGGIGWYRKPIPLSSEPGDERVYLEFEGVYHNAEFWLNGRALGVHPYGYTTFLLDLTPYLERDTENVLSVRVDCAGHEHTRWYSGAGIYRHVWLLHGEPGARGALGVIGDHAGG